MRTIIPFLFTLFLFSRAKSQDSSYILNHINVVDVKTGTINRNLNVKIAGNRIIDISAKTINCKNCKVIDAKGKYLIPGLWDMHVHIRGMESLFFPLLLLNGVTGIRDMHNPNRCYTAGQWRDSINNSGGMAPRIGAVAGCIVDGPGDGRNYGFLVANTPDEGRRIVDTLKKTGADFIKVYEDLSPEVYHAIVDEAKKQKITVAGHVPHSIDAIEAATSGQRSIEHLEDFPRYWSLEKNAILKFYKDSFLIAGDHDFERIRSFKLNFDSATAVALCAQLAIYKTFVDPTMIVDLPGKTKAAFEANKVFSQKDIPEGIDAWFVGKDIMDEDDYYVSIFEKQFSLIKYFKRANVKLLAGTDMSAIHRPVPGYSLHDELELLVAGGLTPLEALRTATINPAKFLDREDELGTVEKGKFADLVILDANPLSDIKNINKIFAVVNNGRYLNSKVLDDLKVEALKNIPASKEKR